MSWLVYALVGYASVAVANITDKLLVDKYLKDSSVVVVFTGAVAAFVGLAMLPIVGIPTYGVSEWVRIILAGMCLQFYLLPYFRSLELEDASTVVPLAQAVPIFSLLLASFYLGEKLTGMQIVGFGFILVGALWMSTSKKGSFRLRKVFWLMMSASFLFALSTVLFKGIVNDENVMQTIAIESIGIGVGTAFLLLLPGYAKKVKKYFQKMPSAGYGALATSETFYVAFRFLLLYAYSLGSVSIVSVLSGIQPVFVLIYSIVLSIFLPKTFHEDMSRETLLKKVGAFTLMLIGLWAIYR